MRGHGAALHLYVNQTLVKVIEDTARARGDAGIIAVGIGQFRFDNFVIYRAG